MQASRLSGIPAVHSSFQKHRSSIDHPKFPSHLTFNKPTNTPGWASLPTPPMSGTPPPEPPHIPPWTSTSRRRKRTDTPPEIITTSVSTAPTSSRTSYPYVEPQQQQRFYDPTMQVATQSVPYLPPLTYGVGPGLTALSHYSPPDLGLGPAQISPRTARRAKAHVASACVNCKKKHLRCDNTRPCRRCVQGGKEDTCRDVEHKKRGRPPLKPEDSSSSAAGGRARGPTASTTPVSETTGSSYVGDQRSYVSGYPPILPNARPTLYTHHRGSSRSGGYTGLQSPYAQPSIAPSQLTATATGFSYPTRPQGISFGHPTQTFSSYGQQPPSLNPEQFHRQNPYAGGYSSGAYQPEAAAVTPSYFSQSPYPREQSQIATQGEPQAPLYSNVGLQLPPIRPSTYVTNLEPAFSPQARPNIPPAQRMTPDFPTQTVSSSQQQSSGVATGDSGRERDPKRPKMDIQGILGPGND